MAGLRSLAFMSRTLKGATPRCTIFAAAIRWSSTRSATADARPDRHAGSTGVGPVTPGLEKGAEIGNKRFADFDLAGKTFVVTGGAQGLGLSLAEALVEVGGKVYCLDRAEHPDEQWHEAQSRVVPEWGGSLIYCRQDVQDTDHLDELITDIADENKGIHGLIAAAGIQQIKPAAEYTAEEANEMLATNYTAVLMSASATARIMFKYKCRGSICLIASMSGTIANKGLISPVYNSSKAAVIQLARNLAMEWSPIKEDGTGGIRVNSLSPGHIMTPMVLKNFEEVPGLKEKWCRENVMGRLAEPSEFKGAVGVVDDERYKHVISAAALHGIPRRRQ